MPDSTPGAARPRPEPAPAARGPARLRMRRREAVPLPALPTTSAADERERREHIRRWAKLMIVHLERADFDAGYSGYVDTLQRLQALLGREIERTRAEGAR